MRRKIQEVLSRHTLFMDPDRIVAKLIFLLSSNILWSGRAATRNKASTRIASQEVGGLAEHICFIVLPHH